MSGNGGHLSSLLAATSGAPPFDPGPRDSELLAFANNRSFPSRSNSQITQEDCSNEPNDRQGFSTQTGHDTKMTDQEDPIPAEPSTGSFATAVRSLFPGGIANSVTPNTAARKSPATLQHAAIAREEVEAERHKPAETRLDPRSEFRRASNMIQKEADSVFTLLPSKKQPELATMKTYTYIAEVHFNKPISETGVKLDNSKEYNIPTCLGQWVKRTRQFNPDLIVLPYREESGANPITHEDQIPLDDCEAISHYFHNHRIENNGILKGMIKFSISIPWMQLKDPRSSYFKWLSQNRVYLRHTSFDADTVVLLGFLYGIPPDAARLLDVTNELMERLRLRDEIKFQVTPRSLTAVHSPLTGNKFGFKALAIETDAKMAGELREALFGLGDPKVQKHTWPVTGSSLFVPMYKTASWTTESISAMAKLHVKMVSNLEQIFVENVHAIDDTITFREPGGTETRRTLREAIQASTTKEGDEYVVHSVHTTNREGVIRILVNNKHALHAKEFFGNIQAHLRATLSGEDLYRITQGKQIQIVGRIAESNESKIYAGYAAALLRENPQDGIAVEHELEISSPQRKKSRMEISYRVFTRAG